jgi:predicted amidohydrolase YtcJ
MVMKIKTLFVAALAIAIHYPAIAQGQAVPQMLAGQGAVDLIMIDGRIKTSSGWAEAMAIGDGLILAVGDSKAIEGMRAGDTQVIDLGGNTVLPGLHDMHVHPIYGGIRARECSIPQGSSLANTQQLIRTCVKNTEPGKWITGGQWDASALGQVPNHEMLDAIAPDNPMLLEDTSGHSAWVNTRALEAAGMSSQTRAVPGGIIERDANGNPTGILREGAIEQVRKYMPGYSDQEVRSALEWSLHNMLSYGITTFTEASVGFTAGSEKELMAYTALADAGILKQRARLCLTWVPDNPESEALIASRNRYARDRVAPDCVKIFLDGVPTDSHTAAMLEPYEGTVEGRDDDASRKGVLLVAQDALNQAVSRFDSMGLTVKFHAAGDAAVQAGLNSIEAARLANGFSGQLHNAGHCTFVSPQDILRARTIAATFEVSPYLWGPSPINDDITKAVGQKRIDRVWPVREMIESGALVVPGSDWSVVPSVNPWIGMEILVTREKPGGSDSSFGKAETITLDQAMDMFTVNSARQRGIADKVGRIEPGMLADVIVVDQNPYEVPITRVHKTNVQMTFIAGERVFDRASSAEASVH